MRRPVSHSHSLSFVAFLSLFVTGCDLHSKTWDAESTGSPTPGSSTSTGSASSSSIREIRVLIAGNGAIQCTINGSAATPSSSIRRGPAGSTLLVVRNSTHESQARFDIPGEISGLCTDMEGRVTVRPLGRNLMIESEGAGRVTFYPRDLQDDIDDCVAFAGEDDSDRLVTLLDADPALINGRDSKFGRTPLARAAEMGRSDVAALLLERRADTEIANNQGLTPLHLAVSHGRLAIVKALTKAGANVNARSSAGETPLSLAQNGGFTEIAAFLSGAGAAGEPVTRGSGTRSKKTTDEDVFDLSDGRDHGPFADGSTIRYKGRQIEVRSAGTGMSAGSWQRFDLPKSRDAWVSLEDTNFRVLMRGKGRAKIWATYHKGRD